MSLRKVTLSGLLAPPPRLRVSRNVRKEREGGRERRKLLQERSFSLREKGWNPRKEGKYSMSGIGEDNGVGVKGQKIEMFLGENYFVTL